MDYFWSTDRIWKPDPSYIFAVYWNKHYAYFTLFPFKCFLFEDCCNGLIKASIISFIFSFRFAFWEIHWRATSIKMLIQVFGRERRLTVWRIAREKAGRIVMETTTTFCMHNNVHEALKEGRRCLKSKTKPLLFISWTDNSLQLEFWFGFSFMCPTPPKRGVL